jgi:starvation-inducible DNA-binding protein
MTVTAQSVPDSARITAASALQQMLPDLVALSLHAKQAHWNVTGPAFLALHDLTDRIAADARTWADRIAERAVALDFAVDARPATVAAATRPFPAGRIADHEAIGELLVGIDLVVASARSSRLDLEQADIVAHDITVEILEGLEKYRWMLQAHLR